MHFGILATMFTPLETFIAWRYTRARRRSQWVSFITALSISGVALGIAALITILSIMNGFEREMRERLLGMAAHLEITGPRDSPLLHWADYGAAIARAPGVVGWAPFIEGEAMLAAHGGVEGTAVRGIDPAREPTVSVIGARMRDGKLESLVGGRFNLILGRGLADALRVNVGDDVTLLLPQPLRTASGMLPRMKRFHVSGIFEAGVQEYDTATAFIALADAAKVFRVPGGADGVRVKLHDPFAVDSARVDLSKYAPSGGVDIVDWTTSHANLFRALATEKIVMFVILLLSVGVAAFNLVSTLVMVVTEKYTEIAVLQTLGLTRRRVLRIFFTQGALIGFGGVLAGGTAGVLLARHVEQLIAWLEATLGFKILAPDVYYISRIPSQLEVPDVVIALACSVLLCLIAPIYPAWLASRTRPAEALRYE
jgi:lipoprotein-releasing system permease protein